MNKKSLIIDKIIKDIPFHGVNNKTFFKASKELQILESYVYFPEGIYDVLFEFEKQLTNKVIIKINSLKNTFYKMKLPDQVQHIIELRLSHYSEITNYRELLKQLYSFYFLPYNIAFFTKILFDIITSIWYIVSDKSTDFNYYTKRLTLSIIYVSTICYFMDDHSTNYKDTICFLNRKIESVIKFSFLKKKIKSIIPGFKIFNVDFYE